MSKKIARLRQKFFAKRGRVKFRRCESWRYVRVKESWRAPRGIDSKMRLKLKGQPPLPSIGYRKPREIRGFHPSGYEMVLIHSVNDVKKVDPKRQAIMIAHTVGKQKRLTIFEEAKKMKILVLNPPRVEKIGVEKPKETGS